MAAKVFKAAAKTYNTEAFYTKTAAKQYITADKLHIAAVRQYKQAAKTKA